jgi:hypothetical protein
MPTTATPTGRPGGGTRSALDLLDEAFSLLAADPAGPSVDGAEVGHGLPDRRLPLAELRWLLLHPSTSHEARDAVLRLLVIRAQTGPGCWALAVAGLLRPGLRRAAAALTGDYPLAAAEPADLDADLVAGLFAAIAGIDPDRDRLAGRLVSAAYVAGRRARRAELGEQQRRAGLPMSMPPPAPSGHPDLLLADAVRAGVISRSEAELIGETRLSGTPLVVMAGRLDLSYAACHQRRRRAEVRLVRFLAVENRPGCGV